MKKLCAIALGIGVLLAAWFLYREQFVPQIADNGNANQNTGGNSQNFADHKNISYEIEGVSVKLTNGFSEVEAAPGSASKITTRYFGNEATGDLDGDGASDVSFLLTREGGGSGTFYYVVAALKKGDEYKGTNAVLLGDRIVPQTTGVRNETVIVNYADRELKEPLSQEPSRAESKYLVMQAGKLTETPIFVESVQKDAAISSPLLVTGVARGPWFFEANLPVDLEDEAGRTIAQSYVMAEGEWMTTGYVRFSGTITFTKPPGVTRGYLVFKKDNPSGLPEHDDSRRIPVVFK